jgi:hypothetical protein
MPACHSARGGELKQSIFVWRIAIRLPRIQAIAGAMIVAGQRVTAAPDPAYTGCQTNRGRDVTLCRCVDLRYFAIFNPRGHTTLYLPYTG